MDRHSIDTLGGRLRFKRKARGWTQQQLADKVGTSQAVIQKIENGKSLRPRNLNSIAMALGVSPAWLMFGKETIDTLSEEALEVAKAWSRLSEPHRSSLRDAILKAAREENLKRASGGN